MTLPVFCSLLHSRPHGGKGATFIPPPAAPQFSPKHDDVCMVRMLLSGVKTVDPMGFLHGLEMLKLPTVSQLWIHGPRSEGLGEGLEMPKLPTASQLWIHGPRSEGPGEVSSEPGAALTAAGGSCPDPPLPGSSILSPQVSMTAYPSKSCFQRNINGP